MKLTSISTVVRRLGLACAIGGLTMLGGCYSDAATYSALGAGAGAGLGAIIGHQSGHGGEGAVIGAGAGALTGLFLGNESDKRRAQQNNTNYDY